MVNGIVQRAFGKSDLPRMVELRRQGVKASFPGRKLNEKRFSERLLRSAGKKTEQIQVLEKGGELIGYVWFGLGNGDVGRYGFLRQLFVREDFRGKGLARKLLSYAEKHLANEGAKSMRLMVTGTNCRAYKFYGKMKYKNARILMEKTL
jgi:ribosomal protein S18 acetylase RimI-like enzyme